MCKQEESEEHLIWLEVVTKQDINGTNGRNKVRMLDDNTIRQACAAKSVHDARREYGHAFA
jgi:hypothetical protein